MKIHRRFVIFALICALLVVPLHRWSQFVDTPSGRYIHNYVSAVGWGVNYTLGPEGLTRWRIVVPECCEEWYPGGWNGFLPNIWIDYCLFCGQPGAAEDEILIWLRAPHHAGYVWSGAIVGWSSADGWWSKIGRAHV